MFFYVFVVSYTQLLVLMLQYHISTTKHSTVPMFTRYALLYVRCILHTTSCTNVTISHITNQPNILPFPCLYGMFFYVFVVFYTQPVVIILQYHISPTNQTFYRSLVYTVCSFMCLLYFTHNHLY